MPSTPFIGKRYINLLRASTNMQDTSTDDQKVANDRFAHVHGMVHVGDVTLKGVSASKTFNRRDLKELLERRRVLKNYDVIVVYDSSRLTRGGSNHGSATRHEFAKVGVVTISVMDPVPDGDFKDVIQSVIDTQNYLYSKKTSVFVSRGIFDAIRNGTIDHHGGTPIGVDRQYYDAAGKPKLRLCYLSGGVRELRCAITGNVQRYGHGELPINAYLLGPGEKSRLVPGDCRIVEAIRHAFRMRHIEGKGYMQIARYFVQQGIRPLRASKWRPGAVRDIVMNSAYLGWSYFLQQKCGLLHSVSPEGPEERNLNQAELELLNIETVPRERRPVADMIEVKHPELMGFITDPEVRLAADNTIRAYFQGWEHRHHRPKVHNGRPGASSRYFLRVPMRDVHHDRRFFGMSCGKPDRPTRYYGVAPVAETTPREKPLPTTLRAEPLETAVLALLRDVYRHMPHVTNCIGAFLEQTLLERPSEAERSLLLEESMNIEKRLSNLVRLIASGDPSDAEVMETEKAVRDLRVRRNILKQQMAALMVGATAKPETVAKSIYDDLMTLDSDLSEECFEKLHLLVQALCPRIDVNLETKEVTVQVALYKGFALTGDYQNQIVCGRSGGQESNGATAQLADWLNFGTYRLIPVFAPPTRTGRQKLHAYTVQRMDWGEDGKAA